MIPPRDKLTICFAHSAYRLHERFLPYAEGIDCFQVWTKAEVPAALERADVAVLSGFWTDDLLDHAPRLRFIQCSASGTNLFGLDKLRARGVRLASAQGVNERAVSDHAMGVILAWYRKLADAVRNQDRRHWRPLISEFGPREDELAGKTLLIVGLGRIGGRLARLAKAFEMNVIGLRQNPSAGLNGADEVGSLADLHAALPRADIVALTCPLTPQTEHVIDAAALAAMKPTAYLVNVARGRCVDEAALLETLQDGRIAGAALDVFATEPLPPESPFWMLPNVLITPHTAGETKPYEDNVAAILRENLERLWRGETQLRNQIV